MSKFNSGLFHGTSGSPQQSIDLAGIANSQNQDETEEDSWSNTTTQRDRLLAEATTEQARRIVAELYRPGSSVGDGGTADAIRHEVATSELVGGRSHIRKGRERLRQIERMLSRNPNHPDRRLLERLAEDLRNALGGTR